jgi:hypothetical protein
MSFAGPVAQDLLSLLANQPNPWNIGGIIPDVGIEEEATDELALTENPVEYGANVTDHEFKKPNIVTLRIGFSNSSIAGFGNPSYATDQYNALRAMQVNGQLITIVTGKRTYNNMAIIRLTQITDSTTPQAMMITLEAKYVIITQTTQGTTPSQNQQSPQDTSPPSNQGNQNGIPSNLIPGLA